MVKKRFMGLFLALVMALALIPVTGVAVFAEDAAVEGYEVWIEPEDGYDIIPGREKDFRAMVTYDGQEVKADDIDWMWSDSDDQWVEITIDKNDESLLHVKAKDVAVGEDKNIGIGFGAYVRDQKGRMQEVGRADMEVHITSGYFAVYPAQNNFRLAYRDSEILNLETRYYDYGTTDYKVIEDVTYSFDYDPEIVRITDFGGGVIEPNQEVEFSKVVFTRILHYRSTGINVTAHMKLFGAEDPVRHYSLYEPSYDLKFDPRNATYSAKKDVTVELLGFDKYTAPGYRIEFQVGALDPDTDDWIIDLEEGTDFIVDGNKVTVYGGKAVEKGAEKLTVAAILFCTKHLDLPGQDTDRAIWVEEATLELEQSISKAKVKVSDQTYTGSALQPAPVVTLSGKKLVKGTDYTVSYTNNKDVGQAKVTIKGLGKYVGTASGTFAINPKSTKLTKVTPASKGFTAAWAKVTAKMSKSQITGYQIQYSTKKNFASSKTVTVKGAKSASKKITNLKGSTTYYVRVRTYMNVSKKPYYSKWSGAKSVKTKK